jgi:small subunit ribosomal protein S9
MIFHSVGKRKNSIAKIFMKLGTGKIIINDKDPEMYFNRATYNHFAFDPLNKLNLLDVYDLNISTYGGGLSGQSGAIRLGIARALLLINEEFRTDLRKYGFLTRDSRCVERKKVGRHKARKSLQYSKR